MKNLGPCILTCLVLCWTNTHAQQQQAGSVDPGFGVPGDADPPAGLEDIIKGIMPEGEEPLVRCKRPLEVCGKTCVYGYINGEDGCPTCECRTPTCEEECEEGYRCHVPTCTGALCALAVPRCIRECPMFKCMPCASGIYLNDEDGCQTCECGPFPCAMPMCANRCEHGYANDENGCMTCSCKEESHDSSEETKCSMRRCRMFCEYGFAEDEQGCEICSCRDQPRDCPGVMCSMFCEDGFVKNEKGCDICKCRSPMDLNACATMFCPPELRCKEVIPGKGVCQPHSICELHQGQMMADDQLMMHHLEPSEELFPGPSRCTQRGDFEPQQCFKDKCVCVDDRGVMQSVKRKVQDLHCKPNVTKVMELAFQLEHDLDDNDLDGAMHDIEELVHESVGKWMALDKKAIVFVQVLYIKPKLLMVNMKVVRSDMYDLPAAAHHLLKNMQQGKCHLRFKDHTMTPRHETFHTKHHYQHEVMPPRHRPWVTKCFGYVGRHRHVLVIAIPVAIAALILIIILIACCARKRKRSASYQFQHKKMENMENFKNNLILSSEWEKPELVCKDDVQVTLTDDVEKKPIA